MRKLAVVFVAMVGCTGVKAQTVNITFGGDSFAAESRGPLNLSNQSDWDYRVGFLYRDDVSNMMFGRVGVGTTRNLADSAPGLDGVFGASLYVADAQDFDVGILALELGLRYAPPIAARSTISAELGFAPDITTFNDGSDALIHNIHWTYEYIPQTQVMLGYRHMDVGIKDHDDVHMVDGWYAGLERRF